MQKKVNNKVNTFLNENADYNTPIYISNVVEVIESFPDILYADVEFLPQALTTSSDAMIDGPLEGDENINTWSTSAAIIDVMNTHLASYVYGVDGTDADPYSTHLSAASDSLNFDIKEWSQIALNEEPWTKDVVTSNVAKFRMHGFNERSFYTVLMKNIWVGLEDYDTYGPYRDSNDFRLVMMKLNNEIKHVLRNGMLDNKGNINNFSLPVEVAQIEIGATYRYR